MPKTYHINSAVRFSNHLVSSLVRRGIGPRQRYILTVQGRKSGKLHFTIASVVEDQGQRWLVAPYGEVGWVRNARVVGRVTLTRGKQSETVSIVEADPHASAPILKKYLSIEPITASYFEAQRDSPVEAFEAEAARHPVFRLL